MGKGTELQFQKTKRRKKYVKGKGLTKKQRMQVQKLLNTNLKPELNHYDSNGTFTTLPWNTPRIVDLTAFGQGSQDTNRIGDVATLRSVLLRVTIKLNSEISSIFDPAVRVMLIQWKTDTVDATPTLTDILQAHAAATDIIRPYKIDINKQYKILYDKTFLPSRDQQKIIADVFVNKGFNPMLQFNNVAISGYNHIFMIILSDDEATGAEVLTSYTARVRYLDA